MSFIKAVFGWLWSLIFGKPQSQPPVRPSGRLVDHTTIDTDSEGKKWKVTFYTDGTFERVPFDAGDPTNEGGFVSSLPKP